MTGRQRVLLWWWTTRALGCAFIVAGGTGQWALAGVLVAVDAVAYWRFRAAVQGLFR